MKTRSPFDFLPTQAGPVGARLRAFSQVWVETCSDQWVTSTIRQGHFWRFKRQPPHSSFLPTRIPNSKEKRKILLQYVQTLVHQQAVVPVPESERFLGFYSPVFLVRKRSGGWRPVLDLKRLNKFIRLERFKMESLNTVILNVQPEDWMVSIDLQDAYLHVPIHRDFQSFLRFKIGELHLQFQCLPFGISTAPRTFTKVLVAILAPLRERGIRVLHYLDDILVLSQNREVLKNHVQQVMDTLMKHGWLINHAKSQLIPAQKMIYLGALFDTLRKAVSLPPEKIPIITGKVKRALGSKSMSASECLSLLGTFSSCIPMVKWARWHLRGFQQGFLSQWRRRSLSQEILITMSMKSSLWWWTRPPNLQNHCHLGPISWITLTSDASRLGWGAHFRDQLIQGKWQFNAEDVVSNILELRAAWKAISHLAPHLKGNSLLLRMDNRAAVAYVQNQGGTHSRSLSREVAPILAWAEENLVNLRATYLPAPQNHLADRLSREFINNNEWSLDNGVFRWICQQWGNPQWDLFASPQNAKTPLFFTRCPARESAGVDALVQPWSFRVGYAFPPTPLILRFLQRLTGEEVTILAVIPYWPRRPWFTLLTQLSLCNPLALPKMHNLLSQGVHIHPHPEILDLRAWKLSGRGWKN